MLQGCVNDGKSGLEGERSWEARESTSLEVEALGKQVTYGQDLLGKRIKIKSRSYRQADKDKIKKIAFLGIQTRIGIK